MATAGDIVVNLTANSQNFTKGINQAKGDLAGLSETIGHVKSAMLGFLTFEGARRGVDFIRETIAGIDDLAASADKIGVTTEFLSEMEYAAKLSDTSIEALHMGLKKMEKTIGQAKLGENEGLVKMLKRAGIEMDELKDKNPEQVFRRIADATSRIKDPFQRAAFATEVFGKGGQELLGLLSRSKEEMEALGKEAKNFGAIVTSEMKDKAGEADDAFKRLDATMLGLKRTLAVEMAPALTDTLGAFTQLVALASKLNLSMLTLANPTTGAIAMLANQMKGLEILFRGLNEGKTLKQINQELIDARNKKLDKIPGINAPEPIDLGGPQAKVDFKQHTNKPADIFSREGFHMLASAIQPAAVNIDEKQLVELKGINKGVGKVQNRLEKLQIPGVGPKI